MSMPWPRSLLKVFTAEFVSTIETRTRDVETVGAGNQEVSVDSESDQDADAVDSINVS